MLALPDEDDDGAPTAYVKLCAAFVHFILVQIVALLFAVVTEAMYFPWDGAPDQFSAALPWLNGAVGFLGFTLFVYSQTSALAATMHLFRITYMYETFQKSHQEQRGG